MNDSTNNMNEHEVDELLREYLLINDNELTQEALDKSAAFAFSQSADIEMSQEKADQMLNEIGGDGSSLFGNKWIMGIGLIAVMALSQFLMHPSTSDDIKILSEKEIELLAHERANASAKLMQSNDDRNSRLEFMEPEPFVRRGIERSPQQTSQNRPTNKRETTHEQSIDPIPARPKGNKKKAPIPLDSPVAKRERSQLPTEPTLEPKQTTATATTQTQNRSDLSSSTDKKDFEETKSSKDKPKGDWAQIEKGQIGAKPKEAGRTMDMSDFVGSYISEEGFEYTVKEKNGHLFFNGKGMPKYEVTSFDRSGYAMIKDQELSPYKEDRHGHIKQKASVNSGLVFMRFEIGEDNKISGFELTENTSDKFIYTKQVE